MPINHTLIVPLLAWFAAQLIKTIADSIMHKKFSIERLIGSGGMPSSHSALVCALAISVARIEGIYSTSFAIAFTLAVIVMYDASGVRRAAGKHAQEINKIKEQIDLLDGEKDNLDPKLKELLGHTPLEVLGGALLGIAIAMLIPII